MPILNDVLFITTPSLDFEKKDTSINRKLTFTHYQPLGVCYLAAILKAKGYFVEVFDPYIELIGKNEKYITDTAVKDAIINKLNDSSYKCIAISAPFIITYKWAHFIASCSKIKAKEIPVIIGGGYPSHVPEHALQDKNIDYVCIGESERTLPQLLSHIFNDDISLFEIESIAYHLEDNSIRINPRLTYERDIDSLPFPDWDLIPLEKYFKYYGKRILPVMTSRGCPFSCTFCIVSKNWGKTYRKRKASSVFEEIAIICKKYRLDEIMFVDDNMSLDRSRFLKIIQCIKDLNIKWMVVNFHANTLDEEILIRIKESGCQHISISVESAVPRILKQMKKSVDLEKVTNIVQIARKIGLDCQLNFILGLPYENKADIIETLNFSSSINSDWNMYSILVPYPGTEIFDFCLSNNFFTEGIPNFEELNQRSPSISGNDWNKEWLLETVYDYNIITNFLNNTNLKEFGNLNRAIEKYQTIVKSIPDHIIAMICLAYAYERKGDSNKCNEYIFIVKAKLSNPSIAKNFEKYLMYNHEIIDFYHMRSHNE